MRVPNSYLAPIDGFTDRLRELLGDQPKKEFAKRLGLERKVVYSWMSGKYYPSLTTLRDICEVYGVSADWLLFGR